MEKGRGRKEGATPAASLFTRAPRLPMRPPSLSPFPASGREGRLHASPLSRPLQWCPPPFAPAPTVLSNATYAANAAAPRARPGAEARMVWVSMGWARHASRRRQLIMGGGVWCGGGDARGVEERGARSRQWEPGAEHSPFVFSSGNTARRSRTRTPSRQHPAPANPSVPPRPERKKRRQRKHTHT